MVKAEIAQKKPVIFAQVEPEMKTLLADYATKEFGGNESLAIRKIIQKFFEDNKKLKTKK